MAFADAKAAFLFLAMLPRHADPAVYKNTPTQAVRSKASHRVCYWDVFSLSSHTEQTPAPANGSLPPSTET